MQKIKTCLLTKQGSALVYSLIILATMLFIVTSISVVSITEKKNASSTDFSVQSFQTANSGFQLGLTKINKSMATDGNDTLADVYGAACDNGEVADLTGAGPGDAKYTLSFKDEAGVEIADCNTLVNKIASIKSVGTYNNTVRAVEVAVESSWAAPMAPIPIPSGSWCGLWSPSAPGANIPCDGVNLSVIPRCPSGYTFRQVATWYVSHDGRYNQTYTCMKD